MPSHHQHPGDHGAAAHAAEAPIVTRAAPARSLSRRRLLGLGAGLAVMCCLPASGKMTNASSALMTRPIPHSGERLPVIGLGTSRVFDVDGDQAGRRACAAVLATLVAGGGRLIDTAPSYGTAESVVGDLVAASGLRPRVFLATKLEDYDPATGRAQLQASLQRLRTPRVDLMQLHNLSDPNQDLALLRDWKAQGLTRYIGITTSDASDFAAIEAVLRREKPDFVQVNYSLADRTAEARVIPVANEVGAAVLTDLPFAGSQLFDMVRGRALPSWAAQFDATSWAQFFLKYLIGNPAVTAVIPGTANSAHMADDLGAGRGRLPDPAQRRQMVALIDALR
ncbi:MAG: aldo/keto reductase [Stellaceae bacterium]